MTPVPPGEPRVSPKPQPIGNIPIIFLFTTCTVCVLFLLWRRADSLRSVVSHQLKTWTRSEGRVRLSEDDGPPSTEFLGDDYDQDNEGVDLDDEGDEPLTEHVRMYNGASRRGELDELRPSRNLQ